MLSALILVCALGDPSCTEQTAREVLRDPELFASPVTCFVRGQTFLAETALGRDLGAGEVVRVLCLPHTE